MLRGHVAIGALRRLCRVIERPGPLSGHAAGLPVVVLVEAAEPTIAIHRYVEMYLVTRGTEFCRLVAHERLEEDASVGFGIKLHHKIMQLLDDRVLARGKFVHSGIFQEEVTLPHRAFYFRDRMAHHAAKASL